MSLTTPCDFAKARYFDLLVLKLRWNYLVFFLGVVVVLFLIVSVVLIATASFITAAVSSLGTLLTGAATTWLTTQRKTISDEEQKAFDDLNKTCNQGQGVGLRKVELRDLTWFQNLEIAAKNSLFSNAALRNFMATLRGPE